MSPHLAYWLRWGLANFLPKLGSNCDSPDFFLGLKVCLNTHAKVIQHSVMVDNGNELQVSHRLWG
jgi:hypothetical protein